MSVAILKSIDLTVQAEGGFEEACRAAITEASKTIRGIMSFKVENWECVVEHDKIITYRVTGKIIFTVER